MVLERPMRSTPTSPLATLTQALERGASAKPGNARTNQRSRTMTHNKPVHANDCLGELDPLESCGTFQCFGCSEFFGACRGAADDFFEFCDDCAMAMTDQDGDWAEDTEPGELATKATKATEARRHFSDREPTEMERFELREYVLPNAWNTLDVLEADLIRNRIRWGNRASLGDLVTFNAEESYVRALLDGLGVCR